MDKYEFQESIAAGVEQGIQNVRTSDNIGDALWMYFEQRAIEKNHEYHSWLVWILQNSALCLAPVKEKVSVEAWYGYLTRLSYPRTGRQEWAKGTAAQINKLLIEEGVVPSHVEPILGPLIELSRQMAIDIEEINQRFSLFGKRAKNSLFAHPAEVTKALLENELAIETDWPESHKNSIYNIGVGSDETSYSHEALPCPHTVGLAGFLVLIEATVDDMPRAYKTKYLTQQVAFFPIDNTYVFFIGEGWSLGLQFKRPDCCDETYESHLQNYRKQLEESFPGTWVSSREIYVDESALLKSHQKQVEESKGVTSNIDDLPDGLVKLAKFFGFA